MKSLIGNIIIAAFFFLFILINVKAFYITGNVSCILLALYEGICVVFFLIREGAKATSTSPLDWGVAFSATFLGTLLRPANASHIFLGNTLLVIGIVANIASVLSLNRSFSIVPAERSIKTGGLYRFVRHPMYLSGIIVLIGFLVVNPSLANVCIVVANVALLVMRVSREELFLSRNETYRAYVAKVRWRLFPFVY